ncbi:flocculation protein FLO11-like isoform X1 [Lingula anatina]|uniref:Flocculation protein FLO11-like isoform X1 n=1 Tax=Lingula anatina TaxID=7574 RepID=A0A1S3JG03_LINAN|nr:flocculation protein FLO11-like isoform X1 [Lingula anatina]|eukprot:XP_013408829.1 flocculation protein FLO11-like isoform X1 [Lingula anatina]
MNHGKQIVLETVPGTNYVQAGYPICDESSIAKPDNMTVMCVQRQGTPANKPPPLLQDSLSQPETLDTSISSYVKTAQKQSPDDSHSMSKKDLMDHSYNEIGSYVKTAANGICLSPPTDPADSSVGSYVQVAASQNVNNNNLNGGVSPPPVENSSNPVGDEYLEPLPSSEAGKMDTVQVPQNQDKSTSKSSLIAVNKAYGIEVPEKNSLENADTSPLSVGDKFSAGGKYVEVSNAPDEEYDEGDGSSMTEKLEQGVTVKLSKPIPEGVDSGKNFGTYAVLDNTDEDDEVFSSYVQGPGSSENYVHTDNEDSFISPDVQKLDSSEDPRVSIENSEYVTEIPKFIAAQEHDTGYVANPNIIPLDNDKQGPIGTKSPAVSASAPVVKASPKRKSDQVVSGNNVLAPVASQIKAGVPLQYPTNGGYVIVPPPVPPSSNTAATYNGYVTAAPPVVPSVVSTANTGYVTDPAPAPSSNTIAADRFEGAPSKVPTVSNITNNGYVTSPPPVTHQAATNSGTAPRTSVASDNTPAGNGYMTAPPVIVSTCVNTNTGYVTAPPILVQSASKATCNGQLRKPLPDTSTVNGYVTAPPPVNNTVNSTRERALPQITSPALNSNGYVTTAPTVLPPATCNNGYVTAPEVQLASAATNHRNVTPIPTTEVSPVFSTTTNGYVTVPPTMSSVPSTTSAANTGYVTAPPVVPSVSTTTDAAVKNMVPPSKLKSQKVPNANTGHVSDPVMVSLKEENNNDAIGRYTHVGGAENSQHRDKGACDGTLKDNYKSTGSDLTHNKNWSNKSSPSHFKMAPVNDQGYVTMPNTTDTATLSHQQDANKRGDLMKRDSGYGSPLSSPKDVINQEDNQT